MTNGYENEDVMANHYNLQHGELDIVGTTSK